MTALEDLVIIYRMNQKSDSKKQKRVPCPYCKELIMPKAIKCRFCGEKLSTKNQKTKERKFFFSTKFLYLIWLLCLIYFLSSVIFVKENYSELSGYLLLITVLIGGIAFLFLFHRVAQPKLFNNGKYGLITLLTFIVFVGMLLKHEEVRALLGIPSASEVSQPSINKSSDIISPTPIPSKSVNQVNKAVNVVPSTNSNLIDCTGPDGKVFKTTQQECNNFNSAWKNPPTPDPSEIIKCTIHVNCGGGFVEMRREDCEKMVCCEADSNNTLKFISKDQCNKEQDKWLQNTLNEGCTTLCSFSTEICYSLYEVGTDRANCIMDIKSQESQCLTNCYNYQ